MKKSKHNRYVYFSHLKEFDATQILDAFDDYGVTGSGSRITYLGDKSSFNQAITDILPSDINCYVEPFGGMFGIGRWVAVREYIKDNTLTTQSDIKIVYNDTDESNHTLFEIIRDEPKEFIRHFQATANDFHFYHHAAKYYKSENATKLSRAVMYCIRLNNGIVGNHREKRVSGFNAKERLNGFPEFAELYSILFKYFITLERLDAFEVIKKYDAKETLHFVDPPYLNSTRKHPDSTYENEVANKTDHDGDEKYHTQLIELLRNAKGRVALCGYPSTLYSRLLKDWHVYAPFNSKPMNAKKLAKWRKETIWTNYDADKIEIEDTLRFLGE